MYILHGESLYEKPASAKETEECCNFIWIQGVSTGVYPHGASFSRFWRTQHPPFILNSHSDISLFPFPFPIGGGTRKVQLSWTACHILPPWRCNFPPKCGNSVYMGPSIDVVLTHLTITLNSGVELAGLCNKFVRLEVGRDINTHFKDINIHFPSRF